jgi:protein-S-isoprenylcysteine O-methyltransferase Ste14
MPRAPISVLVPALFAAAALFTGFHAAGHVASAIDHGTARAWLDALYEALRTAVSAAFALFTIGRAAPRQPSRSPIAFVSCAVAMGGVVAFRSPPAGSPELIVLAGELVAVASVAWLLFGVLFLGRCFGVLPEARGLVTHGPYSVVRHPVYLGEIGACIGLAIAAPLAWNAVLLAMFWVAQWIRMVLEERALRDAFPEYASYATRTGRLLPKLAPLGRPAVTN